jgi:hypothetical protein
MAAPRKHGILFIAEEAAEICADSNSENDLFVGDADDSDGESSGERSGGDVRLDF